MQNRNRFLFMALVAAMVVGLGSPTPAFAAIETAGELFVDLDARDASAGTDTWDNKGTLLDFVKVGAPVKETIAGAEGITFNKTGTGDAYRCSANAPAGLTGTDPTRSIEVWAYNPAPLVDEETMVAWSHRGGGDGTNMSFNYGRHATWGAVGHWGGPDCAWNNAGGGPLPDQWHHLAYTYDGTTTRVYADGVLANSEILGAGVIVTWPDTPILLAQQWNENLVTPGLAVPGSLSLARVRIHDGVLTLAQIKNNFDVESVDFPSPPSFIDAPASDVTFDEGPVYPYTVSLTIGGIPAPTVEVVEPAGATLSPEGLFSYTLPQPAPASFVVTLKGTNIAGIVQASWTVTVKKTTAGQIEAAGTVFVDLDAADATAGTDAWFNAGLVGDFAKVGSPVKEDVAGAAAVTFSGGTPMPAYQQAMGNAPAGIVGPNATASIEVWAYNPAIADEETIVAWGKRGGPDGSNMSFNYGVNAAYGAVGHWGGSDLGWYPAGGAPIASQWHYLVHTFDGKTTRVYADGVETNSEFLGAGVINIAAGTKITLAAQLQADGVTLEPALPGTMSMGRVRVEDGVLHPAQVRHNWNEERPDFGRGDKPPVFTDAPAADYFYGGDTTYTRQVATQGDPAPTYSMVEPASATVDAAGVITVTIADPAPASFVVTVRATNTMGSVDATWTVTKVEPANLANLPVHRYSFTADATDSIGTADGTPYGAVTFTGGQAALGNDGTQFSNGSGLFPDPAVPDKAPPGAYIDLPNGIVSALGNQGTFEAWVTWGGPITSSWQRIFDFGTSDAGEDQSSGAGASYYVMVTPRSGNDTLRAGYRHGPTANERWVETARLADAVEQHVALVWDGAKTTATLFLNGKRVDEETATHIALSDIPDVNNWLGRAQWGDPMLVGSYNEFRIYNYALQPTEVMGNFEAGADVVTYTPAGTPVYTGDANCSGKVDIADAICTLGHLFGGPADTCKSPCCKASMDSNGSGTVDIADAITVLGFLFNRGQMTAPDGSKISASQDGCFLYPVDKVTLPCGRPCTP